ncbi:hypothetical protein SDC9_130606 [bioreactor metagenome]|uniref:Uncharacterized protein n=1 Tax=bioreactor metagenome TaxID=1076179 RepID=A0A645D4H2_9ZZZZ
MQHKQEGIKHHHADGDGLERNILRQYADDRRDGGAAQPGGGHLHTDGVGGVFGAHAGAGARHEGREDGGDGKANDGHTQNADYRREVQQQQDGAEKRSQNGDVQHSFQPQAFGIPTRQNAAQGEGNPVGTRQISGNLGGNVA